MLRLYRELAAMAQIALPLLLKDVTGGARQAEVPGASLAEVIGGLEALYPGIRARLLSPTVAIVVDGTIAVQGLKTPVGRESQVSVLPAFGGG